MQGFLEIQEGKDRMKTKKYFQRLGTTSACVRRMLDAAVKFCTNEKLQEEEQDLYSENGDFDASVPFYEHNNIDNARRAARAQGYLPTRPETAQDSPSAQEQTVSQCMIFLNFQVSLTFIVFMPDNKPRTRTGERGGEDTFCW